MTHDTDTPSVSRRRLLARLGLAATAIYAAPAMLELTPAKASGFSGRGSGGGRRRRRSYSRSRGSRRSFSGGRRRGGGRGRRSFS